MFKINILFNDYHKFNSLVKNHFNITKNNIDIDWNDFEKTLKKITLGIKSNVIIHIYDGILLNKDVLDMLNKYGVEVVLAFNDTVDDDFLINYYFKYIVVDRLTLFIEITGTTDEHHLYYVLYKLWSSYKMYHIYDPNVIFAYSKNMNENMIKFLSENLMRLCDNRKLPIPGSFFEYMMRDLLKEKDNPYIPYDIFTDDGDNIVVNKNKINSDIDFSFPIKDLSDKEDILEKFINILNVLYSSVVETFKCANCSGYYCCQKMNTIFYSSNPEKCSKEYEKLWTAFAPHIKYFTDMSQYTINESKCSTMALV